MLTSHLFLPIPPFVFRYGRLRKITYAMHLSDILVPSPAWTTLPVENFLFPPPRMAASVSGICVTALPEC